MQEYTKYYSKIKEIKNFYERLSDKVKTLENINEKLNGIILMSQIAVKYNTGYWTNSYVEQFLTDYAKTIDIKNYNIEFKPNSYLHVMTTAYSTGGHTRVVERWIENASQNETHSVIILSPEDFNKTVLQKNIQNKNGQLIIINKKLSIKEKALRLREEGLKYEYIILHTHMDDIVPSIAFGTEKFTRPVFLYNHASHLFWIGKSIADLVLDIEHDDGITRQRRNITDTFYLGVPSTEINISKKDKLALRKKLNLPLNSKIIMTSGSENKYCCIDKNHYAKIIEKLIDDNTYCYMIGMSAQNKQWKKYFKKSHGHIIPLGYIEFENGYLDYIASADLYIDSYPFCGGTAMIDAISQGVPSISLKSAYPQFDYLTETDAYCITEEDFINKGLKILNDKTYSDSITKQLQKSLEKYQSIQAWKQRMETLIKTAPLKHKIKNLTQEKDVCLIDDLTVLINFLSNQYIFSKKIFKIFFSQKPDDIIKYGILYKIEGIPYIFQILSYKHINYKFKIIKLFNIKIFEYKKEI